MTMNDVSVYIAQNYKVEDYTRKPVNLNNPNKLIDSKGNPLLLDKRHLILTTRDDGSSWDFYMNYLDICAAFARMFPNSRPSYLLDLGYIPLIMLPTTDLEYGSMLINLLDAQHVPYIRQQPFSFLYGYTNDIDTVDVWIPKMDMADRFNMKPESITSKDMFRRLIIDVTS